MVADNFRWSGDLRERFRLVDSSGIGSFERYADGGERDRPALDGGGGEAYTGEPDRCVRYLLPLELDTIYYKQKIFNWPTILQDNHLKLVPE